MRVTHYFPLLALVATLVPAAAAWSQAVTPAAQIFQPVDESKRITLKGNTLPVANSENDRGQVSPRLPMTDLILVLSRSPQQQAAFEKFVAGQYDPASPNFHRWLSPEEVGQDFGPAQSDIATISNWLSSHGFSVGQLPRDHMSIRFSGTAAEVESCFHTEIHNLEVKGVRHIGNMSDPEIPEALAPAVVGVKSLHNFFPRSLHRVGSVVSKDAATGKWKRPAVALPTSGTDHAAAVSTEARSEFGISVPASSGNAAFQVEDVTPYDFATIYDILPLWTASTPIDGTGQTIAIAGTSSVLLSDVNTFRTSFGLPAYTAANQPTMISGNSQPVTVCSSSTTNCSVNDLVENSLDVEWSGAIAKGANIVLVSSYPASSSDDGLYDSESYIVNNQTASIMNVSYGLCELFNTTPGNVQYYNLWQTASTEGIAVFVSAGDAGSAECDDGGDSVGNPYSAQFGLAVNGIASTPFNTAVGGTDFNWCPLTSTTPCTPAPYWNSTNASTGASASGYIPEVPWNDTCANPLALAFLQQQAAGLKAPTFTTQEGACNFVYNSGGTTGALPLFVDTVGGGGGASNCVVNDGNDVSSCDTSTVTTGSTNGSITLVADGWPKPSWQTGVSGIPLNDGVRDIPDVSFFASDGFLSSSSYLICVSALADCTYSDTAEPTALEVGGTSVSSPAMAGAMALINQKAGQSQGSPNAELYKLAAAQTYSSCSAEKVTSTGTSCYFNDIDTSTIAVPCDFGAQEGSPAQAGIQSPGCTPGATGDLIGILPGFSAGPGYDQATGLGSLNVTNVVNAWPASTSTGKATVAVTPASSSLVASNALSVVVTVANSSSGGATPSGKVTLTGGGTYSSGAKVLASGTYTFNVPANTLPAGSDVFTVSYSGDSTYAAATGSATVAVTAAAGSGTGTGTATANVTVTPTPTSLAASSTLSVAVAVAAGTSGGATPTGTVTLSGGGYTSSAGTLSTGTYTFSIPANSFAAGTDTLTVTYSGDSTYATSTGTATVTVTAAASATGTFGISATSPTAVTAGSSASSTITVTASGSYAGTASLACALTTSPTSAVDPPTCTLSPTSVTLSTSSTSGTATASIATTAATTTTPPITDQARLRGKGTGWMGGSAVLALLVFFGVPARRRLWRSMLGALAVVAALATLSGCGDFWQAPSGGTSGGTTSGTYTFTVTGSGSPAVTAPTATFTLTVNN
jgi:Pro-kumamolisin, activation domain/Bacterial Ig-like domain (group 3)